VSRFGLREAADGKRGQGVAPRDLLRRTYYYTSQAVSPSSSRKPSLPQPDLGKQLRTLRERNGYSRADVAAETGLSASFLALVESGKSDISISRLLKLSELYDIGLADLVPSRSRYAVEIVRKGEHRELTSKEEKLSLRLLTRRDRARPLEPVMTTIGPGGETQEINRATESFLYMLSGEVTLIVEGHRATIIREGDSVYFEARSPRSFRNHGDVPASWLGVPAPSPPTTKPGRSSARVAGVPG
jgi:transcriptional regulator with XRE-family HTH domain